MFDNLFKALFPSASKNYEAYEKAQKKYEEMSNAYFGEAGQKKASQQASKEAKQASQAAGSSARANALNSGYSRAKSARMGQNATAQQFGQTYNTGYQNAVAMNDKAVNNQKDIANQKLNYANQDYQNKSDFADKTIGAISKAGESALQSAFSDVNLKEVTAKTSTNRCEELMERLRGCQC